MEKGTETRKINMIFSSLTMQGKFGIRHKKRRLVISKLTDRQQHLCSVFDDNYRLQF